MKIALIMVKGKVYSYKNRHWTMKHQPDCLTMGMLYSIIKNAFPDMEIDIYDETVENIKLENIHADLVGISALTPAFYKAVEISKYFRSKNIPVFIGGSHATLYPEDCMDDFDSVISGLANETLVELINDYKNNNLKKIYKQSPDMSFERFVFPERHIYEEKHFLATELDMVQATYGCTNVCKFCVQPYICSGYHQRPINDVLEEISLIKTDEIEIIDPNFAKDINYLKEFCKGIKKYNKKWFAPMTMLVTQDEELLKMLNNSGCTGVLVGFESLNTESIDTINKGFNSVSKYMEVIKKFHKYGIEVTGSFVLGLDGDTKETEKELLRFVKESGIDYVRYTINTPFPGTEYYKEMKNSGRLETEDYRYYDCCHCVIQPANLSSNEVNQMFKNLWIKSYSLINILKRLSYIKDPVKKFKTIIKNYIFGKIYISMFF